jgi:hypothetical protein
LITVLKEENHEARAALDGKPAHDFTWLREELGLTRES